jgi:hypothetical protein
VSADDRGCSKRLPFIDPGCSLARSTRRS